MKQQKRKNIRLIFNKYDDPKRAHELKACIENNVRNKYIDDVYEVTGRPHFNELLKYADPDRINIIANSDIYFDETIELVQKISITEAYCLSRHEIVENKIIHFSEAHPYVTARASQDVWIFTGSIKPFPQDIYLGVPGCDNKIAYYLSRQRRVLNPSLSIRCIHLHESKERNYKGVKRYTPPYKLINATSL